MKYRFYIQDLHNIQRLLSINAKYSKNHNDIQ